MIRITVEAGRGATRYKVSVRAESIRRALELVEGLNPGGEYRVAFPIEPEAYFVKDSAAAPGLIGRDELAA